MEHVEGEIHLPSSFNCWFSSSYTCSCSPSNGTSSTRSHKQKHAQNKKQYKDSVNRTENVEKHVERYARIAGAQESLKTELKRERYGQKKISGTCLREITTTRG